MVRPISLDQAVAFVLLPVALAILAAMFVVVVPLQGRPFLFSSERMRDGRRSFRLLKVRSMVPPAEGAAQSALGGDQNWRITPVGAVLRKSRLDEIPQILNVLKGEMKFIGPRPPLRKYVEKFPDLYEAVLAETPPGITGLATVLVHAREERLLDHCRTPDETEDVYQRRCIPIKAKLDLIYKKRRCLRLNAVILWMTVSRLLPGKAPARTDCVHDGAKSGTLLHGRAANTVVLVTGQSQADAQTSKAA